MVAVMMATEEFLRRDQEPVPTCPPSTSFPESAARALAQAGYHYAQLVSTQTLEQHHPLPNSTVDDKSVAVSQLVASGW